MKVTISKRVLMLLLLGLIVLACDKKAEIKQNVFFFFKPFNAINDSVLKVKLVNNSNNNYFITLDTSRSYDYSSFNPKTNSSFIIKPFVYNDDKVIYMIGKGSVQRSMNTDKESAQSDTFYKDYITLGNAVFLKKKSSKYIEIPFSLSHKLGVFTYNYNLEKDKKYELQLEYQMLREITEKMINKSKIDSVYKLGYVPYYEKITSNKTFIILK